VIDPRRRERWPERVRHAHPVALIDDITFATKLGRATRLVGPHEHRAAAAARRAFNVVQACNASK